MVYPALLPLMRTPRLPVVDWTDAPRRFKWTRPFRRKTKSCFCACAITFQLASTTSFNIEKFCVLTTIHLRVLCGSQNKQQFFSVIITDSERVYCAVRTGSLNETNSFVLKGLMFHFPRHFKWKVMKLNIVFAKRQWNISLNKRRRIYCLGERIPFFFGTRILIREINYHFVITNFCTNLLILRFPVM